MNQGDKDVLGMLAMYLVMTGAIVFAAFYPQPRHIGKQSRDSHIRTSHYSK